MAKSEIEKLRDWFIDHCGEILAKIDGLKEDGLCTSVAGVCDAGKAMVEDGLDAIQHLDKLLINEKRGAIQEDEDD